MKINEEVFLEGMSLARSNGNVASVVKNGRDKLIITMYNHETKETVQDVFDMEAAIAIAYLINKVCEE